MHIIVAFNIAACCRCCCCCCHGCAGCTMTMYLIAQQTQTIGFRVSCVASALCYVKRHERTRQTNIWIERRNAGFGGWTRLVQHSLRTLVAFYFFFFVHIRFYFFVRSYGAHVTVLRSPAHNQTILHPTQTHACGHGARRALNKRKLIYLLSKQTTNCNDEWDLRG